MPRDHHFQVRRSHCHILSYEERHGRSLKAFTFGCSLVGPAKWWERKRKRGQPISLPFLDIINIAVISLSTNRTEIADSSTYEGNDRSFFYNNPGTNRLWWKHRHAKTCSGSLGWWEIVNCGIMQASELMKNRRWPKCLWLAISKLLTWRCLD